MAKDAVSSHRQSELRSPGVSWFAVRCFFRVQVTWYEERVTLWRASSHDQAIELAETEALEYAGVLDMTYLDVAQEVVPFAVELGGGGPAVSERRRA